MSLDTALLPDFRRLALRAKRCRCRPSNRPPDTTKPVYGSLLTPRTNFRSPDGGLGAPSLQAIEPIVHLHVDQTGFLMPSPEVLESRRSIVPGRKHVKGIEIGPLLERRVIGIGKQLGIIRDQQFPIESRSYEGDFSHDPCEGPHQVHIFLYCVVQFPGSHFARKGTNPVLGLQQPPAYVLGVNVRRYLAAGS